MMSRLLRSLFAALVLIAATGASAPPRLGEIHATTPSGEAVSLAPGKVTVIHFWATWCAPCRVEMPELDASYRRHRDQGLTMLGISLDSGASRGKIAEAARGLSFPVARLADTDLARRDVPQALPETRIYGRDGRLRYWFRAGKPLDEKTLEQILPPLLAER
jgi:thiol-disulfide isomerase/thioredoxin